jgi:hypothetical protein
MSFSLTRTTINGDLKKDETSLAVKFPGPFPYCPFVNGDNNTGTTFGNAWAGYPVFSALEVITKAVRDNYSKAPTDKKRTVFDALQVRDDSVSKRGFVQKFGFKVNVSFFEFTMNLVGKETAIKKNWGYCGGRFCFHLGFKKSVCSKEPPPVIPTAVQTPTSSLQTNDEPTKEPSPALVTPAPSTPAPVTPAPQKLPPSVISE